MFLAGPFFWSSFSGSSCSDWARREYRKVPLDLEEVLAVSANSEVVSIPALPADLEGLAIPATGSTFVVGDPSARLLIHEATHHLQADHDGQLKFLGRYAVEFMGGLYSGCGPYDSYSNISYERQARHVSHIAQYRYSLHNVSAEDVLEDENFLASAIARAVNP